MDERGLAEPEVAAYLLASYRQIPDDHDHLRACPDAIATDVQARTTVFGCDTLYEEVIIETRISCPHGHTMRLSLEGIPSVAAFLASIFGPNSLEKPTR